MLSSVPPAPAVPSCARMPVPAMASPVGPRPPGAGGPVVRPDADPVDVVTTGALAHPQLPVAGRPRQAAVRDLQVVDVEEFVAAGQAVEKEPDPRVARDRRRNVVAPRAGAVVRERLQRRPATTR